MILFFDTETTGFVDERAPLSAQPHLVQLALLLMEPNGSETASLSTIISPDGLYDIPGGAAKVHGISTEVANLKGISLPGATRIFIEFLDRADYQIAHNWKFDDLVMRAALFRAWPKLMESRKALNRSSAPSRCTMELSCPIVALPPTIAMQRAGRHGHKNPKLSEAYEFFFNEPLVGAHDALVDVRACARIYFHMKAQGMLA